MKNIVIVFIFFIIGLSLNAQDKIVYEGTLSYILHSTVKGETIYSLTRNYSVSQEVLLRYNPFLSEGLKVGQQLKIPVSQKQDYIGTKEKDLYSYYRASNNETLSKIAGYFGIDESDLLECNPNLSNGVLPINQIVRIPNRKNNKNIKKKSQYKNYNIVTHKVARKETLYSISKKYDCSVSDILKLNPEIKDKKRLRKGVILKIPVSVVSKNENKDNEVVVLPKIIKPDKDKLFEVNSSNFGSYKLKKGETLYSIAKRFFVTVDNINNYNPGIKYNDLIPGDIIRIKKNDKNRKMFSSVNYNDSFNIDRTNIFSYDNESAFKTYRIALMIPLYLSENKKLNSEVKRDSIEENIIVQDDSLSSGILSDSSVIEKEYKFYPRSKSFLNFYEGVLLAVDSMKNAGMNVELYTFDTEQKKEVVDSLLNMEMFSSFDLIIGPVFPDLQKDVANFAKIHHIPFISPLSSAGNIEETNPYYFKVNPQKNFYIIKTADYMKKICFGQNIVFLKMGNYKYLQESALIDTLRKKYKDPFYDYAGAEQPDFHEYLYSSYELDGLRAIMKTDMQNIVFIPSISEGQLSVAITNLNTLTEEGYPITLIGLSDYQRYKSIQTEYFYHTNLNYLSSYFIDYKSYSVNNFIKKFRNNFYAEPDNFSFQGYDVAFYFMNALKNYGPSFFDKLPYIKVDLLQNNFIFKKQTDFGGYTNEGLFVVKYSPDYREIGIPYVSD